MDNLVTLPDFSGKYQLSVGQYREPQFNQFIADTQYNLLTWFLGADLYEDLEANIIDQKWLDFLDGAKFLSNVSGTNVFWQGFKKLLIKVVFADWLVQFQYIENETGLFEPQNENSIKASKPIVRQISNKIYNSAVNQSKILLDFLTTNSANYEGYEENFKLLNYRGDVRVFTLY